MLAKCFENLVLASAQNNQVQVAEEYGTLTQDQIGLASSAQAVNPVRGDVGNPDPYMMGQGNMLMTGTLVLTFEYFILFKIYSKLAFLTIFGTFN